VVQTVGTAYDEIKKDTDVAFHIGAGVKYAFTPLIALRLDARALAVPNTSDNGLSPDFEFMAGLAFTLGGHGAPPPPPPAPKDSDGDGILDANDKCPNAAEDKDGFEDADGCPDPDNDKDGIPDASDKCPNEAETKNGIDDDDGCPEKDEDGDGILGSRDKCPKEAEDKDGFEDEDGCPDLDNDKDGIPDARDKCPNEPETKNGFQDEDGCPDEVPAAVAKFTGVIDGITFRRNSADIKPSSFPTLKQAVKVLKEYPALRIEISGHTSDEGKREFNMKLSEKRAASAKAYFVSAGIDEARIIVVGFGPDKPIADNTSKEGQEKNRRIEFRLLSQDEAAATPPAAAAPATKPAPGPAPVKLPAPANPKP
jgi:OOP family OmpA-OmpF porin